MFSSYSENSCSEGGWLNLLLMDLTHFKRCMCRRRWSGLIKLKYTHMRHLSSGGMRWASHMTFYWWIHLNIDPQRFISQNRKKFKRFTSQLFRQWRISFFYLKQCSHKVHKQSTPMSSKLFLKVRIFLSEQTERSLQFAAAVICEEFCQFTVVCVLSVWGKKGGRARMVVANWQHTGCDKVDFTSSLRRARS